MISIDIEKRLSSSRDLKLDLKLDIQNGEFIALTGKSGSGKTTLLRIIAGLEDANGTIKIDEDIWLDAKTKLPPQKREIGFVFQDYALFENMSVEENLLFVNRDRKLSKRLLELTELESMKKRAPSTLSGGQKQRVSLCRALMNRPKLLLMDEPLSALDPHMRAKLQDEILLLHKEFKTTTILVSHDPSEIYKLANRILVLDKGEIIQDGKPQDILLKSKGSAKFSFYGEIVDIVKVDIIYVAIIAIGQQLVKVALSQNETKNLNIGDMVTISTKAFSPTVERI